MEVLISENRLLTALHDVGLTADLLALDHRFHVADIFLNQRSVPQQTLDAFLSYGLIVDDMTPAEMTVLKSLRCEHPTLCVGNAASLALSVSRGYPILAGNTGLAALPDIAVSGLLDLCWVMDGLETIVELGRLLSCFEAIANTERRTLYSPGVATRLQRYSRSGPVSVV